VVLQPVLVAPAVNTVAGTEVSLRLTEWQRMATELIRQAHVDLRGYLLEPAMILLGTGAAA
jgi:hypothetical protein